MKKYRIYIYITSLLLLAYSCQSEENFGVQHPDGYQYIQFAFGESQQTTRADAGYESYDNTKHPSTMGVFGYIESKPTPLVFTNVKAEYDPDPLSDYSWPYKNPDDMTLWESGAYYHFFGYMPHVAGTAPTLTQGTEEGHTNEYTLSFPVSLKNGENASLAIFDQKQAPLIVNAPIYGTSATIGQTVNFKFDQVLAGFNINFKLGTKMDAVRDLKIKSVKFKSPTDAEGNPTPMFYSEGTVSRTYTWNETAKTWLSGTIAWTYPETNNSPTDFSVPYVNNKDKYQTEALKALYADGTSGTGTLTLNSSNYLQWGKDFYVIPKSSFNPVIEVTYDIVTNTTEGSVLTRKDVVSTITLNNQNFKNYSNIPTIAHLYKININIVPRYLYVLADEDQHSGTMIID